MGAKITSPHHAARWGLALAAAAVMLGAVWAWVCLVRRPDSPLHFPLAALGLVLLVSAIVSEDPAISVIGSYSMNAYVLLALGLCAALYYGTVFSAQSEEPDALLRACLSAGPDD